MEPWMAALGVAVALVAARRLLTRAAPPTLVLEKIGAGARIVDVRSPAEFASGAYPGAVNIPLQALQARLREVPKDRPVVVYCASGARSAVAARLLRRAGVDDVVNAGGLRGMPRP